MSVNECIEKNVYRELEEAIAILKSYTKKGGAAGEPLKAAGDFKRGVLEIASFFIEKFVQKRGDSPDSDKELTKAFETIKSAYPLIERMNRGSRREKKLVKELFDSIALYNRRVDSIPPPPYWSERIFSLLSSSPPQKRRKKLELPFTATTTLKDCTGMTCASELRQSPAVEGSEATQYRNMEPFPTLQPRELSRSPDAQVIPVQSLTDRSGGAIGKLQQAFSRLSCSVEKNSLIERERASTKESDLFRMKAITLLGGERERDSRGIQKEPIVVQSVDSASGIVSLFQTLTPFPGETIELKGKIVRNRENGERPIPLSDSFHLSMSSTQTGFPHPSQYTGRALAVQLIPICPPTIDRMELFLPLQERRRELANTLLPRGKNNRRAKILLGKKKEAFEREKKWLLPLHKNLSSAIAKRSLPDGLPLSAIDDYYNLLLSLPSSYDYLSETYAAISEKVIKCPYDLLQQECFAKGARSSTRGEWISLLEGSVNRELDEVAGSIARAESDFELATLLYIQLMGRALSKGTNSILLQELSETLLFPPPLLDDFSRELQHTLYKQLIHFLEEIESPFKSGEEMSREMALLIEEETALFEKRGSEEQKISSLLNELEAYYNERFFSRQ